MISLLLRLFHWNILRSRLQLLIMIVAVLGSLSSYVLLGTALSEMSVQVMESMCSEWPYDFEVEAWFDADLEQQITKLPGLSRLEIHTMTEVFLYSETIRLLALPKENSVLLLELEQGELPTFEDDIVLPASIAMRYGYQLGESIQLQSVKSINKPVSFHICGILSGKKGVLTYPLTTYDGLTRLQPAEKLTPTALIQLDGREELLTFEKRLQNIGRGMAIKTLTQEYEEAQANLTLSDTLVNGLRSLILMISASSLSILLYITLRSGAYQIGVLRAVGMEKPWLLIPAFLQTLLVFNIGYFSTYFLLPPVAQTMGLMTEKQALLQHLHSDFWVFLGVGMLSTLVVQLQFLSSSIPRLFREAL